MDRLLLEEVAGIQAHWEQVSITLRTVKAPQVTLSDVKDYLYSIAQIQSQAISLKNILMSWSMIEKERFEASVRAWVLKGYAASERDSLWRMSSETTTIIAKVDLINEGCNSLTRVLQHLLTVFQIEAKLSFGGHN
jgi:hypothetical protein